MRLWACRRLLDRLSWRLFVTRARKVLSRVDHAYICSEFSYEAYDAYFSILKSLVCVSRKQIFMSCPITPAS